MNKIKGHSLYFVLTEECGRGRPAVELARQAISGGVDMLQMREKNRPRAELVKLGAELCRICKEGGVKFIVNDDPTIAKEVDADGVHLGQDDLEQYGIDKTRMLLGQDKIIGVSTHSPEQFKDANAHDVDYIAFGPIFPTKTKDYFIGTGGVAEVLKTAKKPAVFIGGINLYNVDELLGLGAKHIALIRAISEAGDAKAAAKTFKEKISRRGNA